MAFRPVHFFVIFLSIYLFCAGFILPSVYAQDLDSVKAAAGPSHVQASDTLELPVREKKLTIANHKPFAHKTVLTLTDEDRLMGNLGDVLERMAGMHIVRTGQVGDYLGVSIHGAANNQISVYVNGVLKNSGGDPSLFLGDIDLGSVEKIEIYKGLAPELLTGSPMSGAINIVTRTITSNSAAVTVGSFGNFKTNANLSIHRKHLTISGQALVDQSKGDFTYYDDNGTEFLSGRYPGGAPRKSQGDLFKKVRKNNAHDLNEYSTEVQYVPNDNLSLGVRSSFVNLEKQVSAPFANLDTTVTLGAARESRNLTSRAYAVWCSRDFELEGNVSIGFLQEAFVDTSKAGGEVGFGYNHDKNQYPNLLTSLAAKKVFTENFSVSSIVSYSVDGYAYTNQIKNLTYPWLYRYTGEGKLTPTWVAGPNTFQAMLAASLQLEEEYRGPESVNQGAKLAEEGWKNLWTQRLAYQLQIAKGLSFSLQGGSAYRVPTFFERFGDRGTVLGNPKLQTEKSVNGSADFHWQKHLISGDFSAFVSKGQNIITLETNSQSVSIYRNTGDTRILGCELSSTILPVSWSRTDLALTLQKAENLENNSLVNQYQLIPYQPLTQTSIGQTWKVGDFSFTQLLYFQGKTTQNKADLPNIFDSYSHNTKWQSRFDLSVTWRYKTQNKNSFSWLIASEVRNVFNEQNFDFFNYPLPGRSLAFSTQIGF